MGTPMPDTYVHIRASRDLTSHRPQFVYEAPCPVHSDPSHAVVCQLTTNTNETGLWCSPDTDDEGLCPTIAEWTRLKKSYTSMGTRFATVWQDTGQINMTTGRVESDPKKFAEHLRRKSDEMADRLQMAVDYQPCDPADTYHSDEGLDSQHDEQVKRGEKDSRGRFVWQV